jgi:hypothetical protein
MATLVQLEQLLNDVATTHDCTENFYESLTSYKIVHAWVREQIQQHHPSREPVNFQFKIGVLEFKGSHFHASTHWTESLVSAEWET